MEFNRDVASWVYGTISKMDDGEAQLFTRLLADDLYETDVANNARMLLRHQARVEKAVTDEAAADFLYRLEHGVDPEQLVAEAAAVAIAKDWNPRQPRDNAGRWTRAQVKAAKQKIKADAAAASANLLAEHQGRNLKPVLTSFEQQWNRAPSESGATDAMRRVGSAGEMAFGLGAATGSTKLQVAGAAASLVGQYGPEAEKVVGPAMRRTAYRYRGTERTPESREIRQEANRFAQESFPVGDPDGMAPLGDLKSGGRRPMPTERLNSQAQKDFVMQEGATRHLSTKLPSSRLANLHLQSGQIPPSEGVIIDRNGKVVAQAVGFAEDHYLPFNLKKMGQLNGGRYVRTRTTGGPTTEDIYASLMSGARSFTVVSRSGEFTVDLADDFRGARRASDKARAMVSRYGSILDAVQSEQVRKMPNSARDRAEVRAEIGRELENLARQPGSNFRPEDYSHEDMEREINQRLINRRRQPELSVDDYEKIDRISWQGINRAHATDEELKQQKKIESQLSRQLLAEKGQDGNFKLDGEGYKAALEALKEQFPYFIDDVRVKANRADPEEFTDAKDRGYVDPRYNRSAAQQVGLFGQAGLGVESTKRSAARTNYQNYRERKKQGDVEGRVAQDEPSTEKGKSPAEVAAQVNHEQGVKAATAKRDQTTVHAGSWWAKAVKGAEGTPPDWTKPLIDLDNAPDKEAFVREHGDKVRSAIRRMTTEYASFAGAAPKVIDEVGAAQATKPTAPQNPFGRAEGVATPRPMVAADVPELNVSLQNRLVSMNLLQKHEDGELVEHPQIKGAPLDTILQVYNDLHMKGGLSEAEQAKKEAFWALASWRKYTDSLSRT